MLLRGQMLEYRASVKVTVDSWSRVRGYEDTESSGGRWGGVAEKSGGRGLAETALGDSSAEPS